MSGKNEQLVRLIEALVRKELKEQLPKLVPQVVKEVMSNMILETKTSAPTPSYSNSEKRRNLQENIRDDEYDEYPTMNRRPATSQNLSNMVSWDGDMPETFGHNGRDLITVDAAMSTSETGNPIPIRPDQIPEGVLKAMNKDYSAILGRLNIGKK